jgi:hypothetical protein
MPRNEPEKQLADACSDLLEYDGWRVLLMEPISRNQYGKGFKCEPGMADRLYLRYEMNILFLVPDHVCQYLWIEWKSKDGTLKPHQALWHELERKRGAMTAIAKKDFAPTVEAFLAWYKSTGLCRRI